MGGMGRIAKFSLRLVILAGLGFVVYALFADLPAPTRPVVETLRPAPGPQP